MQNLQVCCKRKVLDINEQITMDKIISFRISNSRYSSMCREIPLIEEQLFSQLQIKQR